MKFEIEDFDHFYSIALKGNSVHTVSNIVISKKLGLFHEDYIKILIEYGASNYGQFYNYYFKNKSDAEAVIEVLTAYLVMAQLTE